MSSNGKVSNVFGDRKEEVVTTPLSEKKSLTKDVEKGTDTFVRYAIDGEEIFNK